MPVVRFSGHILPPMPDLSITTAGRWQDDDLGYAIDVFVEIERSVVTVECSIEDFIPLDIMRLLLRATDTVQAVVDLAAFTKGGPFRVHLMPTSNPTARLGRSSPATTISRHCAQALLLALRAMPRLSKLSLRIGTSLQHCET